MTFRHRKRSLKKLVLTAILASTFSVGAAEFADEDIGNFFKKEPITVSIDGTYYRDSSYDSHLNINIPLSGGEQFFLGAGYSKISLEENSLSTQSALLGLKGNITPSFLFGGELAFWGNENSITTRQVTFNLDYASSPWQLNLRPSYRRISVYSEDFSPSNRTVTRARIDNDNYGMNANLSYSGPGNWNHRFHASYQYYTEDMTDFDIAKYNQAYDTIIEDLKDRGLKEEQIDCLLYCDWSTIVVAAQLANLPAKWIEDVRQLRQGVSRATSVLDRFSNGLYLSSSFEDYSAGYEIGYYWQQWSINIDTTHSRNAVTKSDSNAVSANLAYYQNNYLTGVVYNTLIEAPSNWLVQLYVTLPLR